MSQNELSAIGGCYAVTPSLFFTISGNPKSEEILKLLSERIGEDVRCLVFESPQEMEEAFLSNVDPSVAVFFFDNYQGRRRQFIHRTSTREWDKKVIPEYARNVPWSVQITNPKVDVSRCVSQIFADFRKHFLERVHNGILPWGLPKSSNRKRRNRKNKGIFSLNYH